MQNNEHKCKKKPRVCRLGTQRESIGQHKNFLHPFPKKYKTDTQINAKEVRGKYVVKRKNLFRKTRVYEDDKATKHGLPAR